MDAGDTYHPDRLLNHEDYRGKRPPLSYTVDGDVASLEFCAKQRGDDAVLDLWVGTSKGVVSLLSAERCDQERDDYGVFEAWQVLQLAPKCVKVMYMIAHRCTRFL